MLEQTGLDVVLSGGSQLMDTRHLLANLDLNSPAVRALKYNSSYGGSDSVSKFAIGFDEEAKDDLDHREKFSGIDVSPVGSLYRRKRESTALDSSPRRDPGGGDIFNIASGGPPAGTSNINTSAAPQEGNEQKKSPGASPATEPATHLPGATASSNNEVEQSTRYPKPEIGLYLDRRKFPALLGQKPIPRIIEDEYAFKVAEPEVDLHLIQNDLLSPEEVNFFRNARLFLDFIGEPKLVGASGGQTSSMDKMDNQDRKNDAGVDVENKADVDGGEKEGDAGACENASGEQESGEQTAVCEKGETSGDKAARDDVENLDAQRQRDDGDNKDGDNKDVESTMTPSTAGAQDKGKGNGATKLATLSDTPFLSRRADWPFELLALQQCAARLPPGFDAEFADDESPYLRNREKRSSFLEFFEIRRKDSCLEASNTRDQHFFLKAAAPFALTSSAQGGGGGGSSASGTTSLATHSHLDPSCSIDAPRALTAEEARETAQALQYFPTHKQWHGWMRVETTLQFNCLGDFLQRDVPDLSLNQPDPIALELAHRARALEHARDVFNFSLRRLHQAFFPQEALGMRGSRNDQGLNPKPPIPACLLVTNEMKKALTLRVLEASAAIVCHVPAGSKRMSCEFIVDNFKSPPPTSLVGNNSVVANASALQNSTGSTNTSGSALQMNSARLKPLVGMQVGVFTPGAKEPLVTIELRPDGIYGMGLHMVNHVQLSDDLIECCTSPKGKAVTGELLRAVITHEGNAVANAIREPVMRTFRENKGGSKKSSKRDNTRTKQDQHSTPATTTTSSSGKLRVCGFVPVCAERDFVDDLCYYSGERPHSIYATLAHAPSFQVLSRRKSQIEKFTSIPRWIAPRGTLTEDTTLEPILRYLQRAGPAQIGFKHNPAPLLRRYFTTFEGARKFVDTEFNRTVAGFTPNNNPASSDAEALKALSGIQYVRLSDFRKECSTTPSGVKGASQQRWRLLPENLQPSAADFTGLTQPVISGISMRSTAASSSSLTSTSDSAPSPSKGDVSATSSSKGGAAETEHQKLAQFQGEFANPLVRLRDLLLETPDGGATSTLFDLFSERSDLGEESLAPFDCLNPYGFYVLKLRGNPYRARAVSVTEELLNLTGEKNPQAQKIHQHIYTDTEEDVYYLLLDDFVPIENGPEVMQPENVKDGHFLGDPKPKPKPKMDPGFNFGESELAYPLLLTKACMKLHGSAWNLQNLRGLGMDTVYCLLGRQ
ncbi:unnamed protein product [Amoebophrya sp. A25]|nr:unnamed protein product [Amoebophrya sp. A25]|eukprot:GSA25T00027336001.1